MSPWYWLGLLAACGSDRVDLHDYTIVSMAPLAGIGTAYRVAVDGDTAFVSDEDGFQAFHLDDANGATHLATYVVQPTSSQRNQPLALRDHLLAVAHGVRIALVDVSDPANPVTLSTIATTNGDGISLALAFDDHYLYWGGLNLQRADITDPSHPGTPATIFGEGVDNLLAADGVLYASTNDNHLLVLGRPNDAIANPAAPTLGMVPLRAAGDLLRVGDELYGATGPAGVFWVADVSDHAAPTVVLDTPGSTEAGGQLAQLSSDQLLVPSLNDLTFDWDISNPAAPVEVDAHLVALGYDTDANWGAAVWHDSLLLANQIGFLVVAPTLAE